MKYNYNYHNLLTMDLKPIFDLEKNEEETNVNLTNLLEKISKGIDSDKENINKNLKKIKSKSALLDFIYFHNYRVSDLKLQFSKKIAMKKKIVKYRLLKKENIKAVDKEFMHKISNRFKFDILDIHSVDFGFEILCEIRNIVNEFLVFLKQKSKNIINTIYHPERINFDAEIIILFINALIDLGIAKNQYGKDIRSSKMIKILVKTFILRKTTRSEYTEQTLIKKLSNDYVLKKNINDLNEFKKKVQDFRNEISEMPYIKGLQEALIKKVQN